MFIDRHDAPGITAEELAARLCDVACAGEIHASLAVRELCVGKPITFEDRGTVVLKGISEPAQIYAVTWQPEP